MKDKTENRKMTAHGSVLPLKQVQIKAGFWKDKMELVRTEVIPYQWKALNDQLENAEPSYCMRNFRIAGQAISGKIQPKRVRQDVFRPLPQSPDRLEDTFYGFAFQDSDFSKWIESVAYCLAQHPDPGLEEVADEAIEVVCRAQREDGYLDTYYIIRNPDAVLSNLRDYHELYCFGHLAEGAAAYFQATGKDRLLGAAERFASFLVGKFGEGEGKIPGYPGHEEAELALVRLYELTGKGEYLDLASFFLRERGKSPCYFDREHPEDVPQQESSMAEIDFAGGQVQEGRYRYQQAHLPVRQQTEAVGHAVRAAYLYCGMADVARLTDDEELFSCCDALWENITGKKMYITGSIGGTHIGEAFSHNYDLPADTAYAETCAAIGLVFFARRMLQCRPESRYADVMERALYNGVLSGMALDGKSFFYVNPLECRPEDCRQDARKHHVKPVRQKWFGCACCPPNLARLISSLGSYAFTETEDTLYIHLVVDAAIRKEITGADGKKHLVGISLSGNLPWDGKGLLRIEGLGPGDQMTLALRVPEWADGFTVGETAYKDITWWEKAGNRTENGYLYMDICENQEIPFSFNMRVRFLQAHTKVREAAGQLAVLRGPLVYCLEEADNGPGLHLLHLDCSGHSSIQRETICGETVVSIVTDGFCREADGEDGRLYREYTQDALSPAKLKWIPYYAWANRGENEMRVWVPYIKRGG